MMATFGAGTMGIEAEEQVEREGFTIGHWPQSVELSTVGGWVATRASGQFSTRYGSIEDVVLALEVVLPDGSILRTRDTPRSAAGPDLKQLFMGSEGLLGVVTEVTFSLRPRPESRRGLAFQFVDFPSGLEAVRLIMREGWRPPVVRLYDPPEAAYRFADWASDQKAFLILLHEGPFLGVTAEAEGVAELCQAAGGVPADSAAVDHWLEHRNEVPGWRGFLERGIILDTIEVAATWDRVAQLYEQVTASLREVPSLMAATAHSSHSYRSGTCLYFTFLARPEEAQEMASTYHECWRRTMDVTVSLGAGITHHHGVGRLRKGVLERELGATGVGLLRAIKQTLDPDGLFNAGALLPDSEEGGG
jgi:alkyldihydroxyacetonephosphate synthase